MHVERGQRVVEHQDPGRGEHGPGQREPLPLAAGQRHALLADAGVQTPRQVVDELRRGDLDGLRQLLVSVASGRPSMRFSATDIENSVGSSNAVATICRSAVRLRSRTSTPSIGSRPR